MERQPLIFMILLVGKLTQWVDEKLKEGYNVCNTFCFSQKMYLYYNYRIILHIMRFNFLI